MNSDMDESYAKPEAAVAPAFAPPVVASVTVLDPSPQRSGRLVVSRNGMPVRPLQHFYWSPLRH